MGCFDHLISVRGLCAAPAKTPVMYMDDVFVTKRDMEAFMTSEYSSAEDYFNQRYAFAVKELETLIYNHFNDQFKATSLVDDHRLGIYGNSIATEAGSGFMGIQLEFNPSDLYYKFEISEVSLRISATQDVVVKAYDLRQNKELASLTVSSVSGEVVTDYLNELFYSSKNPMNLFIGYDATGIDSVKTPIKSGLCCGKKSCFNSYLTAKGVSVTGDFYDGNLTTLDHTAGLSIVYSIACDHSKWLCAYANSVALSLCYKTAEIMISDALLNTGGERSTNNHTVGIDELQTRYEFYRSKFNNSYTNLLSNMRLPANKCFHCNTPISHKAFAL